MCRGEFGVGRLVEDRKKIGGTFAEGGADSVGVLIKRFGGC